MWFICPITDLPRIRISSANRLDVAELSGLGFVDISTVAKTGTTGKPLHEPATFTLGATLTATVAAGFAAWLSKPRVWARHVTTTTIKKPDGTHIPIEKEVEKYQEKAPSADQIKRILLKALVLTEMQGYRRLLETKQPDDQILRDLGVGRLAHKIYTPMFEGLALFQEFDVLPRQSNVLSNPSSWTSLIFGTNREGSTSSDLIDQEIRRLLVRYRTSRTCFDRKINVLMSPIDSDDNYYLAGYLSVKKLWFRAVSRSTAMHDPELFICYLIGMDRQTQIHGVGDGATWIPDQMDRAFGAQSSFLIDFYHLSDYLAAASTSCSADHGAWLKEQQERMKTG